MTFDWSKYLDVAKEMAKQIPNAESPQAWARSAISRAYYAAYHKAYSHWIQHEGSIPPAWKGSEHAYIANQFRERTQNRLYSAIGADLRALLTARHMADYVERFDGRVDAKVRDTLQRAERVLHNIRSLQRHYPN